jgi:hypothetical protein
MIVLVLLVVFVVKFAWLLATTVLTAVVARLIGGWLRGRDDRVAAERRRQAELRARADRQHAQVLAGDPAAYTATFRRPASSLSFVVGSREATREMTALGVANSPKMGSVCDMS